MAGWGFEGAEAFLANPVPFHFQRVYADLGIVMIVASVKNISRPSVERPGGEGHDAKVDSSTELHVLYFHQVSELLLDLRGLQELEDIIGVVEEKFAFFTRVFGYQVSGRVGEPYVDFQGSQLDGSGNGILCLVNL